MKALTACVAALGFLSAAVHANTIYDVSLNTASLAGTAATLALDFTAGGTAGNTVSISGYATDGVLGPSGPNSGSASGTLPGAVTLSDVSFFNEELQGLTMGSTISFQLSATTVGPAGSSLPDTFALFILDSTATNSLLTTTDPTGADALFTLQIDGTPGGILDVYNSTPSITAAVTPVPLPSSIGLLGLGLIAAVGWRIRPRRAELPQAILVIASASTVEGSTFAIA
jgi:hypothetical protein